MMSNIEIPAEARQKYIERRKTDLENCKQALLKQDFDVLARVGHQVKGNAVTFGYEQLGSIAAEMEGFAKQKDATQAAQAVQKFADFIASM